MEAYQIKSNWAEIADAVNSEDSGLGHREITNMWRFRRAVNLYNEWATETFPKYKEYAAFHISENKVLEIAHNWGEVFNGGRPASQYGDILTEDNFVRFNEIVQAIEQYSCDSSVTDIGGLNDSLGSLRCLVLDLRVSLGDEGVCKYLGDTDYNKAGQSAE